MAFVSVATPVFVRIYGKKDKIRDLFLASARKQSVGYVTCLISLLQMIKV